MKLITPNELKIVNLFNNFFLMVTTMPKLCMYEGWVDDCFRECRNCGKCLDSYKIETEDSKCSQNGNRSTTTR
jgi:hypothetical protein